MMHREKKHARVLLKTDKSKHEAYKKKERECKQLEQNYHEHEESLGPSTSFSNSTIKSRSMKKAEKSLPQSPREKKK